MIGKIPSVFRSMGGRVLTAAALALAVQAQCGQWVADASGTGVPGVRGLYYPNYGVQAMTCWDPDGGGPASPLVVVAGFLTQAGSAAVNRIAAYDPVSRSWAPLGSGTNDAIHALAALPNGELIAGGDFFTAGGVFVRYVARWNGVSWSPMGTGFNDTVTALLTMPNGDLVAAGYFTLADGVPANRVARWDGSTWSPLGSGLDTAATSLAVAPNGDLFVGGYFGSAGGVPATHVARWNGSTWSALGSGIPGTVNALAVQPNGDVIAGGDFTTAGGVSANAIARWNGSVWSPLAGVAGVSFHVVIALSVLAGGDVVVGGMFSSAGGVATSCIARWDGSNWSSYGAGVTSAQTAPSVHALASLPGGDLFAAGDFDHADGVPALGIARWDGIAWSRTNDGVDGPVNAVLCEANGEMVVGGGFQTIGGIDTPGVARWDGAHWQSLGAGLDGIVSTIVRLANGDLVAGGYFRNGNSTLNGIWRWDGTNWVPIGGGIIGQVSCALALPNGHLVVGGSISGSIMEWDGIAWHLLGGGVGGTVTSLARLANGDIAVGGSFSNAGTVAVNNVARWNGTGWAPFGAGLLSVRALAARPDGDLVAVGTLVAGGSKVLRWTGSAWVELGVMNYTDIWTMTVLANGDVVVGKQDFVPGALYDIVRWDSATWTSMVNPGDRFSFARFAVMPTGGMVCFGGTFVSGTTATWLSRFVSTCPATATGRGSGCAGTFGTPAYAATELPWIGSTFRAHGSGLPPQTLAITVTGFGGQNVPLPPQALPSSAACALLVVPDLLRFTLASGSVDTALAVPNAGILVGMSLDEQVVALELDASSAIVQGTSSNALRLTIGTY